MKHVAIAYLRARIWTRYLTTAKQHAKLDTAVRHSVILPSAIPMVKFNLSLCRPRSAPRNLLSIHHSFHQTLCIERLTEWICYSWFLSGIPRDFSQINCAIHRYILLYVDDKHCLKGPWKRDKNHYVRSVGSCIMALCLYIHTLTMGAVHPSETFPSIRRVTTHNIGILSVKLTASVILDYIRKTEPVLV
jgi:hypothetical protein